MLPFGGGSVPVVLPADPRLASLPALVERVAAQLERELGAAPRVVESDPGGRCWVVRLGGAEPAHHLDRRAQRLVTEAPTPEGLFEALSTLRDLAGTPDGTHPVRDCADAAEVVDRVQHAIATSFASIDRVDWAASVRRWAPRVKASADPMTEVRRWIATLGDAHTQVRRTTPWGFLRLGAAAGPDGAVVLWTVPEGSAAWRAGVRPGWRVEAGGLWDLHGGSPHHRPWVVGRAALGGPLGEARPWTARSGARVVRWTDAVPEPFAPPHITLGQTPSGVPILRIGVWAPDLGPALHAALDAVFDRPRLVIDLRGNPGGNLGVATAFRDRFVHQSGPVGWIRSTTPSGPGPMEPLTAAPARVWRGQLHVLTDARTYSSSEDFLLGVAGQGNVTVIGRPSGGGSGRMRSVRLLPGWRLTISTALTWDRRRRLVEGQGIPVDRPVPWADPRTEDPAEGAADRWT
ncbi:MAG: carboxyl-terminal processing protease [Myxococcota bacterium]|jgi:carboxyl-terminal processing protease